MNIDAYSFGSITIDGKTYRSDLIIYPDKIDHKWWRKSGHLLQMVDLRQITGYKPEILVIGTGASELMRIDPEVEKEMRSLNIKLIVKKTAEAVKKYNKLAEKDRAVCVLHLTC